MCSVADNRTAAFGECYTTYFVSETAASMRGKHTLGMLHKAIASIAWYSLDARQHAADKYPCQRSCWSNIASESGGSRALTHEQEPKGGVRVYAKTTEVCALKLLWTKNLQKGLAESKALTILTCHSKHSPPNGC